MSQSKEPQPFVRTEAAVIGCILLDPATALPIAGELNPDIFRDVRHRNLITFIRDLVRAGVTPDAATVCLRLQDSGYADRCGGVPYVSSLPDLVPSAANLPYFLEELHRHHHKLVVLSTATEITRTLTQAAQDPEKFKVALETGIKAFASLGEAASGNGRLDGILNADELLALPCQGSTNYLGDRLLAAGQSLVIAGVAGLGKSRLLLQLAAASISGRPWIGIETHAKTKRWLVFQAENSLWRVQQDLGAIRDHLGHPDWETVGQHLYLLKPESENGSLLFLSDAANCDRLAKITAAVNPDIVAFDSLYCFASGNLNADEDMAAALTQITTVARKGNPDRAIVIIHHSRTGRAGFSDLLGYDRTSFARNSKLLLAWTRAQINLAPGAPDTNDIIVVSCGKNSNGQAFQPFAIRLDPTSRIYQVLPDFDFSRWRAELTDATSAAPTITTTRVAELCEAPTRKADLAKAIADDCGCSKRTAFRYIENTISAGLLYEDKSNRLICPVEPDKEYT